MEFHQKQPSTIYSRWIHDEFAYISLKREYGVSNPEEERRIRHSLQLPEFNGRNCYDWIQEMEDIFHFFQLGEVEKMKVVQMSLIGEALRWFEEEQLQQRFYEWPELKILMLLRFGFSLTSWQEQQIPARYGSKLDYHEEITMKEEVWYPTMEAKTESEDEEVYTTVTNPPMFDETRMEPEKRAGALASVKPMTAKIGEFQGGILGDKGTVVIASGSGVVSNHNDEGRSAREKHRSNFERGGADGFGSRGGPGEFLRLSDRGGGGKVVGYGSGGSPGGFGGVEGGLMENMACGGDEYGGGGYVGSKGNASGSTDGGRDGEGQVVGCGSGGGPGSVVKVELGDGNGDEEQKFLGEEVYKESLTGLFTGLQEKEVLGGMGTGKGNLGNGLKHDISAEVVQVVPCDSTSLLSSKSHESDDDILKEVGPEHGPFYIGPISLHISNTHSSIPNSYPNLFHGSKPNAPKPNFSYHPTNIINQPHPLSFAKFSPFSTLITSTQSGSSQIFQPNTVVHSSKPMSKIPHSIPISQTQFLQPKLSTAQPTLHTILLYFTQLPTHDNVHHSSGRNFSANYDPP